MEAILKNCSVKLERFNDTLKKFPKHIFKIWICHRNLLLKIDMNISEK